MYESIVDYDQRIVLARALLENTKGYRAPEARFAIARDVACLAAPGWEWIIRKWTPRPKYKTQAPIPHVAARDLIFASDMPLPELVAVILHKTDHLVMGHKDRQLHRETKRWNVASCLENIERWRAVYDLLGIAMPEKLDPSKIISGLDRDEAENLYDKIDPAQAQEAGDDGEPEAGEGEGQPGDGQGDPQPGSGQPGDGDGEPQPGDGKGQPGQDKSKSGKGQPTVTQDDLDKAGNCELDQDQYDQSMLDPTDGVGQDGEGQDGKDGKEGEGKPGDGDGDKPGQQPGKPGSQSGDERRELDPRDQYLALIRLIKRRLNLGANRKNYTLRRPSNRSDQTNGGVLSRLDQTPDSLRVLIDCSGSLDQALLSAIFRAVAALEKSAGNDGSINRAVWAAGDTTLKAVGSRQHVVSTITGNGGTDMKTVIDQAMVHPKMRNGTAWLIVTDGETSTWPARIPRNTIVLLVNDSLQSLQPVPEFIRPSWGWNGGFRVPPHIRRAAICISKKDFVRGAITPAAPDRSVA